MHQCWKEKALSDIRSWGLYPPRRISDIISGRSRLSCETTPYKTMTSLPFLSFPCPPPLLVPLSPDFLISSFLCPFLLLSLEGYAACRLVPVVSIFNWDFLTIKMERKSVLQVTIFLKITQPWLFFSVIAQTRPKKNSLGKIWKYGWCIHFKMLPVLINYDFKYCILIKPWKINSKMGKLLRTVQFILKF